jgi:hypothetical protein
MLATTTTTTALTPLIPLALSKIFGIGAGRMSNMLLGNRKASLSASIWQAPMLVLLIPTLMGLNEPLAVRNANSHRQGYLGRGNFIKSVTGAVPRFLPASSALIHH